MKRAVVLLAAFLGFFPLGCATFSGIQKSAPVLATDGASAPDRTAACIVTEVTQAGTDYSVLRPPWSAPTSQAVGSDYQVRLTSPGGSPLAEVLVTPAGKGSRIEVRAKPWDSQDVFLEAVQRCLK